MRSRKRKREVEEASPSTEAVSEKKLEGDGSHGFSEVEDGDLQGKFSGPEVG